MAVDLTTLLTLIGLIILRFGVPVLLICLAGKVLKYAAPSAP